MRLRLKRWISTLRRMQEGMALAFRALAQSAAAAYLRVANGNTNQGVASRKWDTSPS
jgi:hypothetical protein